MDRLTHTKQLLNLLCIVRIVENIFYKKLIVKQEIDYFSFVIYRCFCDETGMDNSLFSADSLCQISDMFCQYEPFIQNKRRWIKSKHSPYEKEMNRNTPIALFGEMRWSEILIQNISKTFSEKAR